MSTERLATVHLLVDMDDKGEIQITQHWELPVALNVELMALKDHESTIFFAARDNGAKLIGKACRYLRNPGGTGRILTDKANR